jgi:hypothetical protein
MTTTLDPQAITPERIVAAAKAVGLKLLPGCYMRYAGGRPIGCCPLGALAVEIDPSLLTERRSIFDAIIRTGLPNEFRWGVIHGFDNGEPYRGEHHPDFVSGFALGRATRRLAGIDPGPGGTS